MLVLLACDAACDAAFHAKLGDKSLLVEQRYGANDREASASFCEQKEAKKL
jgi:hypothetical protein